MLLPQKEPGTRDNLPPQKVTGIKDTLLRRRVFRTRVTPPQKRTWDHGYPTPGKDLVPRISLRRDWQTPVETLSCPRIRWRSVNTFKILRKSFLWHIETDFNRTIVFPMFRDYLKSRYANNEGQWMLRVITFLSNNDNNREISMVDWSRISAPSWQVTLLHLVKRSFQIVHDCLILQNQIPKLFNTSIQDYWSYQFSEYLRIRFHYLCSSVCGPSGLDKGISLNRKRKWLNMNRKRNLDDVNRTGRGTYLMWTEPEEELTWCEQNWKRNLLDVNRTGRGTYLMWTEPEEELTWCEQNRKRNLLDVNTKHQ